MLKSDVVPSSFAFKQDVMDDSRAKRAELKLALQLIVGLGVDKPMVYGSQIKPFSKKFGISSSCISYP